MGGGSHIDMARELVIQINKVLGMKCQLRGVKGTTSVSQRGLKSQVKNEQLSALISRYF